jgi:hypothetical protein
MKGGDEKKAGKHDQGQRTAKIKLMVQKTI